jgi:pimeloyl-ACP methyl ester carboxylesterase
MLLHTEILGDGEPIVFLHTGLQTGMTDFEEQREYFQTRYKVILPDLRGHGKSTSRDLSNYYEESAMDLKDTLDHLGVGCAHIVGCSIGALVALFLTKRFPEKVKVNFSIYYSRVFGSNDAIKPQQIFIKSFGSM